MDFLNFLFGDNSKNSKDFENQMIRNKNEKELRAMLHNHDVDSHTRSEIQARLHEMEYGDYEDGEDY